MPTRASLPETRTHSWSLVYFKSAGYIPLPLLGTLVERHRDHVRADTPSPDVDFELRAGRGVLRREVRHANCLLEERRLRAARHDAGLLAADVDIVPVAA